MPSNIDIAEESSCDSVLSSASSVSQRKRDRHAAIQKTPGVFHFYSDSATFAVNDIKMYISVLPRKNHDYTITWYNEEQKIRLVTFGVQLNDCKESQIMFEKLMSHKIPLNEAIDLCEHPQFAKERIRKEISKKKKIEPTSSSSSKRLFPKNDSVDLGQAIRFSHNVEDFNPDDIIASQAKIMQPPCNKNMPDAIASTSSLLVKPVLAVVLPAAQTSINPEPSTDYFNLSGSEENTVENMEPPQDMDDTTKSLFSELAKTGSRTEKADICYRYAAIFFKNSQEKVPLYPTVTNILISKLDRANALQENKNNPAGLQRTLLKFIAGKQYIGEHSAHGQRSSEKGGKSGHPACDKDLLKAVQSFVLSYFRGQPLLVIPRISATFNAMAGNIRREAAAKSGKYVYEKKTKENTNQVPKRRGRPPKKNRPEATALNILDAVENLG